MQKEQSLSSLSGSRERTRALEFLALSPTEKYDALITLIKIANEIRNVGKEAHKLSIKQ